MRFDISMIIYHVKKACKEIVILNNFRNTRARAPINDQLPSFSNISDNRELQNIIGKNGVLRYAIRDVNQGLLHREDCPFYFYRAIKYCWC